jgi:uncharacterized protein
MKTVHVIAWILLVIGGLNWLLIGLGVGDVVAYLGESIARIVYILVGISAIVSLFTHKKDCKACDVRSSQPTM